MKKNEQVIAFLGKNTEFEGGLRFYGTIRIDGHFKGVIVADGTLIVGEDGLIEANIHISNIVINGEVHGNIIADKRIDILAPGKVFGDIQAPTVVIHEGVIFDGNCRMGQAKETDDRGDVHSPEKILGDIHATHGVIEAGAVFEEKTRDHQPDEADEKEGGLGTIYGIAIDKGKGKPIKTAEVKAECKGIGKKNTKTNASGYYELNGLKDGKWKLKINTNVCKKSGAAIEISGGGRYEQNFE